MTRGFTSQNLQGSGSDVKSVTALLLAVATVVGYGQPSVVAVHQGKVVVKVNGSDVSLIAVEPITASYCAGVVEKALEPLVPGSTVQAEPSSPNGAYVINGGRSLNAVAIETGCARVAGGAWARSNELQAAAGTAQSLQRGHYAARAQTDAELAASAKSQREAEALAARIAERGKPTDISFVAAKPMVVRKEPNDAAPTVGKLALMDIVMVYRAEPGWLSVDLLNKAETFGWIRVSESDGAGMIPESWLNARMRKMSLESRKWPVATKLDILRKRVRVGFTTEQVELALGAALSRASEETGSGVTQVWVYPGQTVTFKAGVVTSIKRVE